MPKTETTSAIICMAFDSMRVAPGRKPRNYQVIEVVTWMKRMGRKLDARG